MSQVKYYHVSDTGLAEGVSLGRITVVLGADYDAAQSELAALREELATAKRNEHNSEVAYKAAIEKQEELRAELADSEEELDTVIHHNIDLQQRLADAERRNAELQVYDNFVGYLLDYCEGETIYEESLQRWLAESIERNALAKPEEAKS
jgi:multidrug efflux pump subunit AcrA (membrane-fusion protein)